MIQWSSKRPQNHFIAKWSNSSRHARLLRFSIISGVRAENQADQISNGNLLILYDIPHARGLSLAELRVAQLVMCIRSRILIKKQQTRGCSKNRRASRS